jgi:hypothetical protein
MCVKKFCDVSKAPYNVPLLCKQITGDEPDAWTYIQLIQNENGTWTCSDSDCVHDTPTVCYQIIEEESEDNLDILNTITVERGGHLRSIMIWDKRFPFICDYDGIWMIHEPFYSGYKLIYIKIINILTGELATLNEKAVVQSVKLSSDMVIKANYNKTEED